MNAKEFNTQFANAVCSKDKKLNIFLKKHFYISDKYPDGSKTLSQVSRKNGFVKEMSAIEKRVTKARLKQLEENNDTSKSFPSIISIIAALLFIINVIVNMGGDKNSNASSIETLVPALIIAIILCVSLVFSLTRRFNFRETAIYMNSLLADALNVEKEDSTKDIESEKVEDNNEIETFSEVVETADSDLEKESPEK